MALANRAARAYVSPTVEARRLRLEYNRLQRRLDVLQGKLNDIGGALFNAYIFQNFNNLEDEIMVQQEEQQQQQMMKDKL